MDAFIRNIEPCETEVVNESLNWMYEAFSRVSADPLTIHAKWWDADDDWENNGAIIQARVRGCADEIIRLWKLHDAIEVVARETDAAGVAGDYQHVLSQGRTLLEMAGTYRDVLIHHNDNRPFRDPTPLSTRFMASFLRFPHYPQLFNAGSNEKGFRVELIDLETQLRKASNEEDCKYTWQRITHLSEAESVYRQHLNIVQRGLERFGVDVYAK
jgi:hypothetical protein